jgi:hypothetical protein
MIGPEIILLLIILGGYWLFRNKYLSKHPSEDSQEKEVFIAFAKKFGLTLLIIIAVVLITTLIVQGLGNNASSGGFLPLIIIPIGFFLVRLIWKK